MKQSILLILLLGSALVYPARANTRLGPGFFEPLRDEILKQQVIASNAPIRDKRLLNGLKQALKTIRAPKSNYLTTAQSLGVLARTLNRTSVSNLFNPIFQQLVQDYIVCVMAEESSLSNRLSAVIPSKWQADAEENLAQLHEALRGAEASDDVSGAASFLKTAAKKLARATALASRAEKTRPRRPRGFYFSATTNPGGEFDGTVGKELAGVIGFFNGILNLSVVDPVPSNPQRDIIINALWPANLNVPHTFSLGSIEGDNAKYRLGATAQVWQTTDDAPGTLTITEFDTERMIIGGTFSFSAPADPDGAATGTVTVSNGRFRWHYQLLGP